MITTLYSFKPEMTELLHGCIRRDYPAPNVNFIDVFPLIDYHNGLGGNPNVIDPTAIAFIPEARGFLFWNNFRYHVPLRKKSLPLGSPVRIDTITEYDEKPLFYSTFHLNLALQQFKQDNPLQTPKFIIFDDLIATGGTVKAIIEHLRTRYPETKIEVHTFLLLSNVYSDSIPSDVPVYAYYSLDTSKF